MNNKKPSVLLVNPEEYNISNMNSCRFPVSLLYIAGSLESIDIEVNIVDLKINTIDEIVFDDYLFVGITMLTGRMIKDGLNVLQLFKDYNPDIPTVIGGVHPTLLAEQSLKNELVDFVVMGEGEETIKELSNALLLNDVNLFQDIKGLAYKVDNKIHINSGRVPSNMDELPIHLPYHLIGHDLSQVKLLPLHTSRGCPFRCAFCYNVAVNERKYRTKSASLVIQELDYILKKYPNVIAIDFQAEDEFFIYPKRIKQLFEAIEEQKIKKIHWSAFLRWDTLSRVDDDLLNLIYEISFPVFSLGSESGNQRVLDEIIIKDIKINQIIEGTLRLTEKKINHISSFMCCLPTESLDELKDTLKLVRHLYEESLYFSINGIFMFNPIPGTHLFDRVVKDFNFNPPQNLIDWGDYEMGMLPIDAITWQTKRHALFCQDLSNWAKSGKPFAYFRTYNDFINDPMHKNTINDTFFNFLKYIFMSAIQRLRYKTMFFKYPFEFELIRQIERLQQPKRLQRLINKFFPAFKSQM